MFLATTALSEFWDIKKKIVFLGPWCILYGKKEPISGLEYNILPNPWSDKEKFYQAYQYCQVLFEDLLVELGDFLNQVHGVKFGLRYWRILLGPWILRFLCAYYDRYVCLIEAIRHYPNFDTWLLDEQDYLVPFDTVEFIHLVTMGEADLYNLQLYSQILRGLGYTFPAKKAENGISARGEWKLYGIAVREKWWKALAKRARKLIYRAAFSQGELWLHFSAVPTWKDAVRLALTPGFKGRFLLPDDLPPWRGPLEEKEELRERLTSLSSNGDSFRKILLQNLPVNFPKIFLEGFGQWRRQMLEVWFPHGLPKLLVNSGGLWMDESAKLLAAEMTARGGKILSLQHGGGYGSNRLVWPEQYEREISGRFACWGWAEQENDIKLVNVAFPKLATSERKSGESRKRRTILVVGNQVPRYLYLYQSHPVGTQIEKYIQDLLTFLAELGDVEQKATLYRWYPSEFGWHINQRVQDRFPDVVLDDHGQPFSNRINEARLVVVDYPYTAMLEVMAANVPLVLFFDSRVWQIREEAEQYFNSLRRVGIFQDTPAAAARKVGEVYDRVDDWWFSDQVQAARWEFTQHFARSNRRWPREWVAWFRRELSSLETGNRNPAQGATKTFGDD
jgi:putative transferase (TIGR04331 family)